MTYKRAVITGTGIICALGKSRKEILKAVKESVCALKKITSLPLEKLSSQLGGEVNIDTYEFPRELSKDKASQLALQRLVR